MAEAISEVVVTVAEAAAESVVETEVDLVAVDAVVAVPHFPALAREVSTVVAVAAAATFAEAVEEVTIAVAVFVAAVVVGTVEVGGTNSPVRMKSLGKCGSILSSLQR